MNENGSKHNFTWMDIVVLGILTVLGLLLIAGFHWGYL